MPLLREAQREVLEGLAVAAMSDRASQCDRLLNLLLPGEWVELPRILDLRLGSHSRRMYELRQLGWIIETDEKWVHRERHTRYRLLGKLTDQVSAA
jgi:hypothetical protein